MEKRLSRRRFAANALGVGAVLASGELVAEAMTDPADATETYVRLPTTTPMNGQALVYDSSTGLYVGATVGGSEIAYAQITAQQSATNTRATITGLQITVPVQSGPFTLEMFIPFAQIKSKSSGAPGVQGSFQFEILDGAGNPVSYTSFARPWTVNNETTNLGMVLLKARFASLGHQATYHGAMWRGGVATSSGIIYAGNGQSTNYPPAYLRATSP
jgi:hypothetical protein